MYVLNHTLLHMYNIGIRRLNKWWITGGVSVMFSINIDCLTMVLSFLCLAQTTLKYFINSRKNPKHKEEFSHPGDSSFEEEEEEEEKPKRKLREKGDCINLGYTFPCCLCSLLFGTLCATGK